MLKRLLALLLALVLLPVLPAGAARGEAREISAAAYAAVEALWDELEAAEDAALQKDGQPGARSAAAVAAEVVEQPLYVEGSLRWNGDSHFTFETSAGVTCGYSAPLRARCRPVAGAEPAQTGSYSVRGTAGGTSVSLIEPYYGLDVSFTMQYQREAEALAGVLGGTCTVYRGNSATVDAVADALEESGVVFFDSHGDTDYANGDDCTTGATTSYLLLQTGSGLTTADYALDGRTYHALYMGRSGRMNFYAVDGACIANHMEKKAPDSLLWSATCLGMATDGIAAPLRERGVAVAYGYSQAVTFDYDYLWENVFFRELKKGQTVSAAAATMKREVGAWDCCEDYPSLPAALRAYCAFPIFVSQQDAYPGKGRVDGLQTVRSDWQLPLHRAFRVTARSSDAALGRVEALGCQVTAFPADNAVVAGYTLAPENAALVEQTGNVFTLREVTADCCLTVHFAAKTPAVIRYHVPEGCQKAADFGYVGEELLLSAPLGEPTARPGTYRYAGWTDAPVDDAVNPPQLYACYTPTQPETTLYAVYRFRGADAADHYTTEPRGYAVTARVSDGTLGSVSVSGSTVTAHPAPGARVAGWTLSPEGAAVVRRDGDRFTLRQLTADCCLTVLLEAKTPARVRCSVPAGCTAADCIGYTGEPLALRAPAGRLAADEEDYRFLGWAAQPVQNSAERPQFWTEQFTPAQAQTTLYALYTYRRAGVDYYTTAPRVCHAARFADASAAQWYHDALDFVVDSGYMNGVADGRFDPEGRLTRAMLVTILYRMSGEQAGGKEPFSDVSDGDWFAGAVAWGYESGVVNGVSATSFCPNDPITREQVATMLCRYAAHLGQKTPESGSLSAFRDAERVSAYARAPMRWAVGAGILHGMGDGTLNPQGTARRSEIAQMIFNWLT